MQFNGISLLCLVGLFLDGTFDPSLFKKQHVAFSNLNLSDEELTHGAR